MTETEKQELIFILTQMDEDDNFEKVFDLVDRIADEAYSKGYDEGYEEGHADGISSIAEGN